MTPLEVETVSVDGVPSVSVYVLLAPPSVPVTPSPAVNKRSADRSAVFVSTRYSAASGAPGPLAASVTVVAPR